MQRGKNMKKKFGAYFVIRGNKNLCLIHCLGIMQKNTKVTAKLMRQPAHNVWCLPSLSHESDRYCAAKKNFPLGFHRVTGTKAPRSSSDGHAPREFDIANYSRYIGNENIRLVDAASPNLARWKKFPREFFATEPGSPARGRGTPL